MGEIKNKLASFKAPRRSAAPRGGKVKPFKPQTGSKGKAPSGGKGGGGMSPTSMFYLGRTMKRDREAQEMGVARDTINVNQGEANFNNSGGMQQSLQTLNDQLDAMLGQLNMGGM